uniref:Coatomer subunit gamma n=1 Tax=Palpitomonas bilix TaxID=652834 RepID=A0A7S3DM60_9EUKA
MTNPMKFLDKGAVLQESRIFDASTIDSNACAEVINKLLYLKSRGSVLTTTEATKVFFGITKLFQSKDVRLRRLVYLALKELPSSADEVIIVTSSLMKDMVSNDDLYRANAIRVLCGITDTAMLAQIERYLQQAIVDREPFVASAALVSGCRLAKNSLEIVKRWVNEVQQVAMDKNGRASGMVQYHALELLQRIKQNDRLAMTRLVTTLSKSNVKSSLAQTLLVRYTSKVVQDYIQSGSTSSSELAALVDFLESSLRHKSDMVIFEAARAICKMRIAAGTESNPVATRILPPAVTVLQMFLSSPRATVRFAAARSLSELAIIAPGAVAPCNIDLAALISDSNRSVATMAITTLLKTGTESGIDRLLNQIQNFLGDIGDEFRVVVIEAIRGLCLKYPAKHRALLQFLATALREEGSFEYKKSIVDTMMAVMEKIPQALDIVLCIFCEFIEDCEYTNLSNRILYVLGKEGVNTQFPSKFVRYIYNRVVLEGAPVRGAAVNALAQFAAKVPSLRRSILPLSERGMFDADDEVRERATMLLDQLKKSGMSEEDGEATEVMKRYHFKASFMEQKLLDYVKSGNTAQRFDFASAASAAATAAATMPVAVKDEKDDEGMSHGGDNSSAQAAPSLSKSQYEEMLSAVPELASFGPLLASSSSPVDLTEGEAEYVVNVVKHFFANFIVLQFNVKNTLEEMVLEDVAVRMDGTDANLRMAATIPAARIGYNQPGICFVAYRVRGMNPKGAALHLPGSSLECSLTFSVKEVDPATGEESEEGMEDEYQLEPVELTIKDFVIPSLVADFDVAWNSLNGAETKEVFDLQSMQTINAAVAAVKEHLGMQAAEGSDKPSASATHHTLKLYGLYVGQVAVMVKAEMVIDQRKGGVKLRLTARSESEPVRTLLVSLIS